MNDLVQREYLRTHHNGDWQRSWIEARALYKARKGPQSPPWSNVKRPMKNWWWRQALALKELT